MQRIEKQFGARLASLIADSPTLMADLKSLRRAGVRIRRLNGVCRAYSRSHPGQKRGALICIGAHCTAIQQAHYLAHEAFHILYGKTPHNFDPNKLSRKKYVQMALREEAHCLCHELKVALELHDAGHFVGAVNLSWLVDYLTGGYRAVRKRLEHEHVSVAALTYPQYYGWLYDRRAQKTGAARRLTRRQRTA
ncbi:MAG TPA: hypothetical protein V6D17_18305 [Candidatus Obscuribacterales bacterium]